MRARISSRTSLNAPTLLLVTGGPRGVPDQCRLFFARGNTGHASLEASQTVIA
jgi:hypothetical protein